MSEGKIRSIRTGLGVGGAGAFELEINLRFECFLSLEQMEGLYRKVLKKVKPEEDNIRLYWIPADALPQTRTIGSDRPEPPPTVYII